MKKRLQDKVAIITGAGCVGPGWGNGRSMAYRFMEEGASILAVDKSQDTLTETLEVCAPFGEKIKTHICDATNGEAVSDMMDVCVENFGRLDILVNNVGGSKRGGPVELTEEDWDSQIDHNLKTVFLGCKFAIPHMERAGGGAIVNIASTSGIRWSGSAQVAYAATKAGVIQMSRVIAVEYAPRKIRVNSILPGPVEGDRIDRVIQAKAEAEGVSENQTRDEMMSGTTLNTFIPKNHISSMILYLCSEAGSTITGQAISVDGGLESVP